MATRYFYDKSKNKDGTQYIAGVPLSDLTDEQYDSLPGWLRAQVDASPLYRKSNPAPKRESKPKAQSKAPTKRASEKPQDGRKAAAGAPARAEVERPTGASVDGQQADQKPGETLAGEEG